MPATSQLAVSELVASRVRDEGLSFKLCHSPSPRGSLASAVPIQGLLLERAGWLDGPVWPSKAWAFPQLL